MICGEQLPRAGHGSKHFTYSDTFHTYEREAGTLLTLEQTQHLGTEKLHSLPKGARRGLAQVVPESQGEQQVRALIPAPLCTDCSALSHL